MEQNVDQFLQLLASSAPTPGGGGAAALCGALAIALGNMVGNLTLDKKKYAGVQEVIAALNVRINTKSMTDRSVADAMNSETDGLLARYAQTAEEICQSVNRRLI